MTESPAFPDIHVFWEMDAVDNLTIAIRGPTHYLKSFGNPSEVLYQFLSAIQARGVNFEHTAQARIRYNKDTRTFLVKWTGRVHQNPELVHEVLPALTQSLGATSFGDNE